MAKKSLDKLYKEFEKLNNEERKQLRTKLLSGLFNAITIQDVLTYELNRFGELEKMRIGQTELPMNDAETLISGAQSLKSMAIWEVLVRTMKYMANRTMYEKSLNFEDMLFGKALLFNVNLMENVINDIMKIKMKKVFAPTKLETKKIKSF